MSASASSRVDQGQQPHPTSEPPQEPREPPSPLPTNIYKILVSPPPASSSSNHFPATDLDLKDGFIHLSSPTQTPETARLYFSSFKVLYLLELPLKPLSEQQQQQQQQQQQRIERGEELDNEKVELRWEGPRGCAHLYGLKGQAIRNRDVGRVIEVRRNDEEEEDWISAMKRYDLT